MGDIVKLPDVHQGYYTARKVLIDPTATREQIIAACDVLAHSRDWMDIVAVRAGRKAVMHYKDCPEITDLLETLAAREARAKGFDPKINTIPGNQQLSMTWERQNAIQRDMTNIMRKMKPPIPNFDVSAKEIDSIIRRDIRIGLQFNPVFYQARIDDLFQMPGPSEHTTYLAMQIARELSSVHADEVAAIAQRNLRDLFRKWEKIG